MKSFCTVCHLIPSTCVYKIIFPANQTSISLGQLMCTSILRVPDVNSHKVVSGWGGGLRGQQGNEHNAHIASRRDV